MLSAGIEFLRNCLESDVVERGLEGSVDVVERWRRTQHDRAVVRTEHVHLDGRLNLAFVDCSGDALLLIRQLDWEGKHLRDYFAEGHERLIHIRYPVPPPGVSATFSE